MKVPQRAAFVPPGWMFILGMIVIVAGANFLVVRGQTFLGVLLFDPALMAVTRENFQRTNSWSLPISFAVPTFILFFYFWKIARGLDAIRRGERPGEIARRRLINLPAFSALISMAGWLIGSSSVITYVLFSSGPTYPGFISGNLFLAVLNALLCFVFIYYAVEYLNQVLFVPLFFPEGRISEVPGTLFFRVRTRFYIFFLAISLYPVATLVAYLIRLRQEGIRAEETGMGILFSLIALAIAAALTYMISRSYHRPLAEMKTAVGKIRRGDYSTRVQVLSNDEAGLLGEALNEMSADLRDKEMMKDAFGKMVDPAVRDHILSGEVKLGGEIREATILFMDIRNFTGLSEHRDPEETVEWLNRFFTEVGQAVATERGFINKFIGDAVMAVFGAPLAIPDHADRALRAALGIRRGIARLNDEFREKKLPPLHIGIGIHTGRVLAGNIGSSSRMEYTAIGDAVNLASRVEGLCRNFGVDLILTGETAGQLSSDFKLQALPDSPVKGREKPVAIFTIPDTWPSSEVAEPVEASERPGPDAWPSSQRTGPGSN